MSEKLFIENENKKNNLYLTVIKNLIRRNKFNELVIQLKNGDISQNDFDKEIKKNPNKYNVSVNRLKDPTDATFVIEIYRELVEFLDEVGDGDISLKEIGELFSVDSQQLKDSVELTKSNIRKQFNM